MSRFAIECQQRHQHDLCRLIFYLWAGTKQVVGCELCAWVMLDLGLSASESLSIGALLCFLLSRGRQEVVSFPPGSSLAFPIGVLHASVYRGVGQFPNNTPRFGILLGKRVSE